MLKVLMAQRNKMRRATSLNLWATLSCSAFAARKRTLRAIRAFLRLIWAQTLPDAPRRTRNNFLVEFSKTSLNPRS